MGSQMPILFEVHMQLDSGDRIVNPRTAAALRLKEEGPRVHGRHDTTSQPQVTCTRKALPAEVN
jgi:hypothetical protein